MGSLFLEREAMTWLTPTSTCMIVTTQITENDLSSLIVWDIYVKNSLPPQLAANQSTIIMFPIKFSQHWIFVVNSLLKNGWVWPLFPSISAGWKVVTEILMDYLPNFASIIFVAKIFLLWFACFPWFFSLHAREESNSYLYILILTTPYLHVFSFNN